MKKLSIFFLIFSLSILPAAAQAQTLRTLTLKDGSKIQGKIISFADSIYTVESPILGAVKFNENDIVNISSQELTPQAIDPQQMKEQMSAMQTKILSDPSIVSDITNIAQDKDVMQLLSDPTLLDAVKSFDAQKVQNHPGIQKLMQNEKMQNLMNKAGQKLGYPSQTNTTNPPLPTNNTTPQTAR